MADSPTTFTPFELFGTTFQQTSELLTEFAAWYSANSKADKAKQAKKVRKLIQASTAPRSKPRGFWDAAFRSVDVFKAKGSDHSLEDDTERLFDIDMGLIPFTVAVEYGQRDDFEDLTDTWWTAEGVASKEKFSLPKSTLATPRRSRANSTELGSISSRRSSRSRSSSRVRSTPARISTASVAPVVTPAVTPAPSLRSLREGLARSELRIDDAASRRTSLDPYPFQDDRDSHSLRLLSSPPRATKRPSVEEVGNSRPDDSRFGTDADARLQASDARSSAHVPAWFSVAKAYRDPAREEKVKSTARNAYDVPMPYKTRLAIIRSEYVDLSEINSFDSSKETIRAIAVDDDGLVKTTESVRKKELKSALEWLRCWEVYVSFATRFYPERTDEFNDYRAWIVDEFERSGQPFAVLYSFDVSYRRQLGTGRFAFDLREATRDTSMLLRHYSTSAPAAPPAGDSRTPKRTRRVDPTELCNRFQDDVCPGRPDCLRGGGGALKMAEEEEAGDILGMDETVRETLLRLRDSSIDNPDSARLLSGVSSIPSLRRSVHSPSHSVPFSRAIDSTLSQAPFSRPPQHIVEDPVLSSTLKARPDLFSVSTPIRVNILRVWLKDHPNRPLVDSVLEGLTNGFWPGHNGDFSAYPPKPLPKHKPEDDAFLLESAREDFRRGYMSDTFDALLPGMLVSPSHVIRPESRKVRQVCDQTMNGLNDGIDPSSAGTQYDTLKHLGLVMRHARRTGSDTSSTGTPTATLWKSDVAQAFRQVPVSPYWQLKQIHKLRTPVASGVKVVYMVDQRLILGGRLSPLIWCTVLNLVLWGTRHHFARLFPLAFVDDVFGLDCSQLQLPVTHPTTNETRLAPREQAIVLLSWNLLGIPWDWKKQEHSNSSLVILGHAVNVRELSFELPAPAKANFIAAIKSFLGRPHSDSPPLIDWRRLAGYGQWVCYSIPLAKFSLKALYTKIGGKTARRAPVHVNVEVRDSLTWLANQVATAPPLSFLDPALEEWGKNEADLVIFTDACLKSDDGGPGLGFWWSHNGQRFKFAHRSQEDWSDIAFAEGLAILSALFTAASFARPLRRILVLTDSALSVYAFDSGRASPALHSVVWAAYRLLDDKNIDLRVRHISGERNATADILSRVKLSHLFNATGPFRSFDPPTNLIRLGGERQ